MKYPESRKRMKGRVITVLLSLCLSFVFSNNSFGISLIVPDTSDYYSNDYLRYDNHVYRKNIQAVELSRVGFELADPIITLNTDERFHVGFDELDRNFTQYYYQIQHCTADWEKSEIWTNEYLEGNAEEQVEKYEPSFNTRTIYTHYDFIFPNDRFIIKKSGNYILRVYSRDASGNEINAFTSRFMVVDPKVKISSSNGRAGTSEDYEKKQEVNLSINTDELYIFQY